MVKIEEGCAKCGKSALGLYGNAAKPGELLCFACLSAANPRQVAQYPGWLERESRHEQRAQVAGKNFRLA